MGTEAVRSATGRYTHILARKVGTRLGTRYVAACGVSFYLLHATDGTISCDRCKAAGRAVRAIPAGDKSHGEVLRLAAPHG